MEYENEVNEILKISLFENWMSDNDYNEVLSDFFRETNISKDILSEQIAQGVKNGHSIEFQINLVKKIIGSIYEK